MRADKDRGDQHRRSWLDLVQVGRAVVCSKPILFNQIEEPVQDEASELGLGPATAEHLLIWMFVGTVAHEPPVVGLREPLTVDLVVAIAKAIERTREVGAFEDLLDAGVQLKLNVHHGLSKPHVKSTHGRCICPNLSGCVFAMLPTAEGILVGVGRGDAFGRRLRQEKTGGADVTSTARRRVGVDRDERQLERPPGYGT